MIYKCKYLGYSLVELGRNGLSDVYVVVEHTGEGFVFHDVDIVFPGHFLDPLSKVALSFCKNDGCVYLRGLISYSDCVMSRVCDNDICFGKILHHTAA